MKKIEKYTGTKTYMFPNGHVATPEAVLQQFPAALAFAHVVETDEAGEVLFALMNLSALRSQNGIENTLTETEAIAAIETIVNTPPPEPGPSPEERMAAALEFQSMMMLRRN